VKAKFLDREKRFIVRARVGSRVVKAFLSQTGRLTEILQPGTPIVMRRTGGGVKFPFEVLVAFEGDTPVVIDSRVPNMVAAEAFEAHSIKLLNPYTRVLRERKVGDHRIDFILQGTSPNYLEVKGCTLRVGSSALYPDAPTERGREHLKILANLQRRGISTTLLFLAMRPDVTSFKVNSMIDPEFGELLRKSMEVGTQVISYSTSFSNGQVKLNRRLRSALEWPHRQ
jgi:sugar fermentation stimulation protein A